MNEKELYEKTNRIIGIFDRSPSSGIQVSDVIDVVKGWRNLYAEQERNTVYWQNKYTEIYKKFTELVREYDRMEQTRGEEISDLYTFRESLEELVKSLQTLFEKLAELPKNWLGRDENPEKETEEVIALKNKIYILENSWDDLIKELQIVFEASGIKGIILRKKI